MSRVKSGRYSQAASRKGEADGGPTLDTAGTLEEILDSTAITW
jgi:hypothetical protein